MKFLVVFLSLLALSAADVLTNCQLVNDLRNYGIPESEIPTWVCICTHESSLNTAAINTNNADGSYDYGIFQLNSRYWCSGGPAPQSNGCGITCDSLIDNDINNDITCSQLIYSGSGFGAWTTYAPYCQGQDLSPYVAGC